MKGIIDRLTPDGIRILRIHYSADMDKNPLTPKGAGWFARELIGYPNGVMSAKWRKEMEIDPEAQGGQLAFPLCEVNAGEIFITFGNHIKGKGRPEIDHDRRDPVKFPGGISPDEPVLPDLFGVSIPVDDRNNDILPDDQRLHL